MKNAKKLAYDYIPEQMLEPSSYDPPDWEAIKSASGKIDIYSRQNGLCSFMGSQQLHKSHHRPDIRSLLGSINQVVERGLQVKETLPYLPAANTHPNSVSRPYRKPEV